MNTQTSKLFFLSFIFCFSAFAQTHETIRSARPGQSIGPYAVGTGYLQIQQGADLLSSSGTSVDTDTTNSNTVFRLGLSEHFELSTLFVYQDDSGHLIDQSGVSQFHLGFRYTLIDHPDGWLPGLGLQTRFKLDSVSSEYQSDAVAPIITLIMQHRLSDSVSLLHNIGVNYSGNGDRPLHFWTSNLSISLTESWGTFLEAYGNETLNGDQAYINTGLSYLLNKDLQLDAFTGWGNNNGVTEHLISLGVSWRAKLFRQSLLPKNH